jgi:predicted nucleotidyltransferase
MYTTSQILIILKQKKKYLQKRYPISELGIFGSYARVDFNEKSDIDILVDFKKLHLVALRTILEPAYE